MTTTDPTTAPTDEAPRATILLSFRLTPEFGPFADVLHAGNTIFGALVHHGLHEMADIRLDGGVCDATGEVVTAERWANPQPEDMLSHDGTPVRPKPQVAEVDLGDGLSFLTPIIDLDSPEA